MFILLDGQTQERGHHLVKGVKHKTSVALRQRRASYGMGNGCKVIIQHQQGVLRCFAFLVYHQVR
jgi:hypothetical protein